MPDFDTVERGFSLILEGLGINTADPHFRNTHTRAAKALYYELCGGLTGRSEPGITTFPVEPGSRSEMIVSKGIPVRSICAHHFLPFIGEAVVGYIPHDQILGLSKMSRAVEHWARRPQVQEQLTSAVADFLVEKLYPDADIPPGCGVGVIIQCRHHCMELRGVQHTSNVTTSALRGAFHEAEVRSEFLKLAGV